MLKIYSFLYPMHFINLMHCLRPRLLSITGVFLPKGIWYLSHIDCSCSPFSPFHNFYNRSHSPCDLLLLLQKKETKLCWTWRLAGRLDDQIDSTWLPNNRVQHLSLLKLHFLFGVQTPLSSAVHHWVEQKKQQLSQLSGWNFRANPQTHLSKVQS